MNILTEILANKRTELLQTKKDNPLSILRECIKNLPGPRDFAGALVRGTPSVIAEIKRSSPSRGILEHTFDHRRIAREYEEGGAAALSVLTDGKFFGGQPEFISEVRSVCSLPVLRKDFVLEEYQVFESRALEADAVLLIARVLELPLLRDLIAVARSLRLSALVEIHNEGELESATAAGADIIGINNRDLADFTVSIDRSISLRSRIPAGILAVSESGIHTSEDVAALREVGFHAVLVGESLMKASNRVEAVRKLVRG